METRTGSSDINDRLEQVRAVIEDCARRRSSGEVLLDSDIVSSHPGLMPELGRELGRLATVSLQAEDQTATSAGIAEGSRSTSGDFALPDAFAGYQIRREIHRGGQGVVYEAIQKSTRRRVAIKALHGGPLADPRAQARIEREVHILGQIDHPNIVGVHDSGSVSGCLYYTMDYISGLPLDRYLAKRKLSQTATLLLFARICEAVNAAHLRGVIHRDLKPSNILIDQNGEPHIVDFGLAKLAVDAAGIVDDSGAMTMTGQFLGSVPWASPEQAEGTPRRIDIRTDVYSLGVMLYQFLAGRFPYEVSGKLPDVLGRIMREEPARPSTIRRRLNGELDTIVLKSLAKEPERRYQSAGELARDIRHYLAGEPIEARRDSTLYVLKKSLLRYRVPAAVGLGFLILLIGFAITMTFLWQQVQHEARKTALVANFLDDVLLNVDPDQAQASVNTPLYAAQLETVRRAAEQVQALSDDPEVEARVRNTIGRLFMDLGQYREAYDQLRRAAEIRTELYGRRHADTADTLHHLAWALKELGRSQEAETLYREVLDIRRELFGDVHPAVADTMNNLGQLYFAQQQYQQAEPYLQAALDMRRKLGSPEKQVATALANLGSLMRETNRLDQAEALLSDALDMRRALFGDEHFHTVVSMNKLGLLLRERGRASEARELLERALELRKAVLPDDHPHIAVSMANLGIALLDEGRPSDAAPYLAEALARFTTDPAANLYRIQRTLTELTVALKALGDYAAAEGHVNDVLDVLPLDTPQSRALRTRTRLMLIDLYVSRSNAEEAADLATQMLAELESDADAAPELMPRAQSLLGAALLKQQRYDEAEAHLLNGFEGLSSLLGDGAEETQAAAQWLAELYSALGRHEDADRYWELLSADE